MTDGVRGVVLVTVDSLRADALDAESAPTLTGLADDATRFEHAFAHGNWTPFSFPSILSGDPVFAESRDIGLSGAATLAETLRDADVRTAGFNAANGFLTEPWGYDRGFDEFEPFMSDPDGSFYGRYLAAHPTVQGWLRFAGKPFRRLLARVGLSETDHRPDVERYATEFVAGVEDEPFFCWVHYMDAHTPYVPAPRHVRQVTDDRVGALRMLRAHARTGLGLEVSDGTLDRLRTLYRASVRQIDESVGRLLDTLESAGVRDETMVVVAGDHGEEFLEHGHLAHYPKLYEELVHVPFFVDHPDGAARGVEAGVGLDAIPPTVCDAMGVEPPESFDGDSALDVVREDAPVDDAMDEEPVVSVAVRGERVTQQPIPRSLDEGELLVSARTADWTYIRHAESGDRELYDRRADPFEQESVLDDHPGVADRLDEPVERRIESIGPDGEGDGPGEVPDEVESRLEVLGYR